MNGDNLSRRLNTPNALRNDPFASVQESGCDLAKRFTASSLTASPTQANEDNAFPGSVSGSPPFRILIAEDNTAAQLLLHTLLDEHCDVTMVSTAQQAFEALRPRRATNNHDDTTHTQRRAFDMVMVDTGLEGAHSGAELLVRLRDMEALHDTPVVALTAHASSRKRTQRPGGEIDATFRKPFTPSELFSIVLQITD